jgi:imidazole glycerol-phosphate synthase subunit HisH
MSRSVHIIDYGVGNLLSVCRAIEKVGGEPQLVKNPSALANADRVVLPGVGAFRDGMAGLSAHGLDEAVCRHAETGRPILGICLGMQMLVDRSFEFGEHVGLGLIKGDVLPIPSDDGLGGVRKVPFIGWAELSSEGGEGFAGTPLSTVVQGEAVYLVHSYYVATADPAHRLASYGYDGATITAAIARDNIIGYQFHPEKSGECGLRILNSFLKW